MKRCVWLAVVLAGLAVLALPPLARYMIVRVPDAVNLVAEPTALRFEGSGITVVLLDADGSRVPAEDWPDFGPVSRQEPDSGSYLVRGMTLTLYARPERRETTAPYLVGLFVKDAQRLLEDAGLSMEYSTGAVPAPEFDVVISQEPTVGATVTTGDSIRVVAQFPHTDDGTSDEVRSIHGIFYLRNGLEGAQACDPCHSPSTCSGEPCHIGSAYEQLQRAYPPPGP